MDSSTKQCPFCGEEIKAVAIKCRYCGEFMKPQEDDGSKAVAGNDSVEVEKPDWDGMDFSFCGKLFRGYIIVAIILLVTGCFKWLLGSAIIVMIVGVCFAIIDQPGFKIDRKKLLNCSGTMYYAKDIFEYLSIFYWFSDFKRIKIDLSTVTGINFYKLGDKYFVELSGGMNRHILKIKNETLLRDFVKNLQEVLPGVKTESRVSGGVYTIYYTLKIFHAVLGIWCILHCYNRFAPTGWQRPEWLKNSNELVKLRVDCANEIKAEFARDEKLRKWKISDVRLVKDEKVENMYSGQLYLEYKGYAPVLSVMVILPDDGSKFTWTLQAQELQQLKERYIY